MTAVAREIIDSLKKEKAGYKAILKDGHDENNSIPLTFGEIDFYNNEIARIDSQIKMWRTRK